MGRSGSQHEQGTQAAHRVPCFLCIGCLAWGSIPQYQRIPTLRLLQAHLTALVREGPSTCQASAHTKAPSRSEPHTPRTLLSHCSDIRAHGDVKTLPSLKMC